VDIDQGLQEPLQLPNVEQKAQSQLPEPELAKEQVKAGSDLDGIVAFLGIALVIVIVVTAVVVPRLL